MENFVEPTPPTNACKLQYISYPTLSSWRKGDSSVPNTILYTLLCRMPDVLDCLFNMTVEHNDIKPCNILISENNMKLIDFGLARFGERRWSLPGGTPPYVPPEVAAGRFIAGKRDIFAFGITMLRALGKITLPNYWIVARATNPASENLMAMCAWMKEVHDVVIALPQAQRWLGKLLQGRPQDRCSAADLVEMIAKSKGQCRLKH